MDSFDVIVIGVGAMGSAACWQLAKRGVRVLGLEKNGVPNTLGSSHGFTRMTRTSYYEHPNYVPLVRRANVLWRELEGVSGQKILHQDGALYMGAPGCELISGSQHAADVHGIDYSLLDRAEISARWPQFNIPSDSVGMFEREAGYLRPELGVATLALQAMLLGAEIHGAETVTGWSEEADGVVVRTDQAEYRADQVVVTSGAWTSKICAELGVPLVVTRQVLGWVWPSDPAQFQPGKIPVWAVGHDDGSLHYGFPMLPDNPGLKVSHHAPGSVTDPDTVLRTVSASDSESFLPFVNEYLPTASGPIVAMRICMYVNSPDSHFIIDRLPGSSRVTIGCGFSGHGFKFTPAIGEALADLASLGRTELPIEFLNLSRFNV